jgi:hypothetical protein
MNIEPAITYTREQFMELLAQECEDAGVNDSIDDVLSRTYDRLSKAPAVKAGSAYTGDNDRHIHSMFHKNELVSDWFPCLNSR